MPRTSKAEQHAATRAALLAAGQVVFSAEGYDAAGTERIVQAAGVTRGALYYHFKDKRALFEAVFEALEADLVARIDEIAMAAPDPVDALVEGCLAFVDACQEPRFRRIVLVDGPAVLGWRRWREIDREYGLSSLAQGILHARDAGAIVTGDPSMLASLLSGATNEGVFLVAEAEDPAAARAAVKRELGRLVDGLRV